MEEALEAYEREVCALRAELEALRPKASAASPSAEPKYVLRYLDGVYNVGQGFEGVLSEATRYSTREEAESVAKAVDICEVVEVLR